MWISCSGVIVAASEAWAFLLRNRIATVSVIDVDDPIRKLPLVVVGAATLCLVACSGATTTSQRSHSSGDSAVSASPDGLELPRNPSALTVVRFSSLNATPAVSPVQSGVVNDPGARAEFVRILNGLPRMPSGVFCPADFGDYYRLDFAYVASGSITVKVDASGCRTVTSSSRPGVTVWAINAPALYSMLAAVAGVAPEP